MYEEETESIPYPMDNINVNSLAADIALFGDEDLVGVLRSYGLTRYEYDRLLESSSVLNTKIKQLQERVGTDPNAVIRAKANAALEGHIKTLNVMASDSTGQGSTRLSSIRLLAELADALPKAEKGNNTNGMVVNVNFGETTKVSTVRPVNIIDHE